MGQRRCIFCGEVADNKEHLLPEWLKTVFPSDEPGVYGREVGGRATEWTRKPFEEKTKFVCEDCNHGWMSDLENEAKPLLTPAIARRGQCEFDLRGQWILARWAVKTCYVMQMQAPAPLAPSDHPVLLNLNFRPPPQVSVWVGSHVRAREDPTNSVYLQNPLRLTSGDEHLKVPVDFGYMSFLAVGGISFLMVEHRFANYVECVLGEDHPASDMFIKIWPRTRRLVAWPPSSMADRQLIDWIFDPVALPVGFDARIFSGRFHKPPFREAR